MPRQLRLLHLRPAARPASTTPTSTPDAVLAIARRGAAVGCHEALFTLGERPELRYEVARRWLAERGYDSTLHYLHDMAALVLERDRAAAPRQRRGAAPRRAGGRCGRSAPARE